jgi:hypothetical protein
VTFSPAAVLRVIEALNTLEMSYIVTGSLARNVYCPPRSTIDGDFVVIAKPNELEQLFDRLRNEFQREEQMAFETVTGKIQHKLRHRKTKFLIEIFEAHLDDPHERSRFERRQPVFIESVTAYVTTAEDVVVQKLRWFKQIRRAKDRDDVIEVLIYQWQYLDWAYVEHWCKEHQTDDLFNELKTEAKNNLERTGRFDS